MNAKFGSLFEAKTGKKAEFLTSAEIDAVLDAVGDAPESPALAHVNTGEVIPPWTEEKKREFHQVMVEQCERLERVENINSCDNTPPWTEEEKRKFLQIVDTIRTLPTTRAQFPEAEDAPEHLNHPELLTDDQVTELLASVCDERAANIERQLDTALGKPLPPWIERRCHASLRYPVHTPPWRRRVRSCFTWRGFALGFLFGCLLVCVLR